MLHETTDRNRPSPASRADYGIDAPGIMLGLSLGGGAAVLAGCMVATFAPGAWRYLGIAVAIFGAAPLFFGLLMVIYALVGKTRTRERILTLQTCTATKPFSMSAPAQGCCWSAPQSARRAARSSGSTSGPQRTSPATPSQPPCAT